MTFTLMILSAVATAEPPLSSPSEQEFLEFLGGWELEDGTWINPLGFLESDEIQGTDKPLTPPLSDTPSHGRDHDKTKTTPIPKSTPLP